MTKHHPTLINTGKTPSITLVKESSQPSVSSFFKKSSSESCNQLEISQNETNIQDSTIQNVHSNISDHDEQEMDEPSAPCASPPIHDNLHVNVDECVTPSPTTFAEENYCCIYM